MIGAYLIHTITLKQYKGKDDWGEHIATTDVSVRARVEYKERVVQVPGEEFKVSSMRVIIRVRDIVTSGFTTRGSDTIAYQDLVTVDGVEHTILQITTKSDFRARYMEVVLS